MASVESVRYRQNVLVKIGKKIYMYKNVLFKIRQCRLILIEVQRLKINGIYPLSFAKKFKNSINSFAYIV